jgi:CCR4-NOT transcription complex subunit 6
VSLSCVCRRVWYRYVQQYPYCDSWALSWPFRLSLLAQELEEAQGDIVCLQEVQADHYESSIQPMMQGLGYDGIFKQKSRESMGQYGKVNM